MGKMARALVSVSDKTGLVETCRTLAKAGVVILSTGGTARALREANVPVTDVSEYTGSPEIMDGRVKTLHPRVHGGILMRDLAGDRDDLARIGGGPIDLVICNLYPFEATVARGASYEDAIENIDIGGPCMIRAAAKNFIRVASVVDPADYGAIIDQLAAHDGCTSLSLRYKLACRAFAHTAEYDSAIAEYLAAQTEDQVRSCYTAE